MFGKIVVSKSAALLKMDFVAAICSKIKLVFISLLFVVVFSGEMVSCLKEVF